MASNLRSILSVTRLSAQFRAPKSRASKNFVQVIPSRSLTCTETGAVLAKPEQTRFGVTKSLLTVIPFLYFGGAFASKCAALLEDYELFVPEDDDDD